MSDHAPSVWTTTSEEASAVAGVRPGDHLVDLAHPLHAGTSHYPTHVGFSLDVGRRHGDRVRADGSSSASCHLTTGSHVGTHLDALGHISQDGLLFDGSDARASTTEHGLTVGGIEQTRPFVGHAIVVDLVPAHSAGLPADHEVTAEELSAAVAPLGEDALVGAAVLLRTGWERHWETPQYVETVTPGPGLDSAVWLADRGVTLVGSDTATFERGPVTEAAPVHTELIVRRRIQILENLRLQELASYAGLTEHRRAAEVTLLVIPLPIRGGTGSPVRPLALVPQ